MSKRPPMRPVLVVEDDEATRESLRSILADSGFEVYCAANGRLALNLLGMIPRPCVIVLDLMMPVMDGRELLAELRADDRLARIPVTVITAGTEHSGLGDVEVIRKPFDIDALLDTVTAMAVGDSTPTGDPA